MIDDGIEDTQTRATELGHLAAIRYHLVGISNYMKCLITIGLSQLFVMVVIFLALILK